MDRLIEIIFKDLELSKLKCEERMEKVINSDIDITQKVISIKSVLEEIVLINNTISLWTSYVAKSLADPTIINENNEVK